MHNSKGFGDGRRFVSRGEMDVTFLGKLGLPLHRSYRLTPRFSPSAAYVIGNSKFYGPPLPSDEILAEIFRHFGFELERMRRRQSKTGLYEAVGFLRRH